MGVGAGEHQHHLENVDEGQIYRAVLDYICLDVPIENGVISGVVVRAEEIGHEQDQ